MKTIRRMFIFAAFAAFASLTGSAHASCSAEQLRCSGLQLRVESTFNKCLARCAEASQFGSQSSLGACETRCEKTFKTSAAILAARPPCTCREVTSSPAMCEAKVLGVEAGFRLCKSRCTSRGEARGTYDEGACLADCGTRCEGTYDATMRDPVCGSGMRTKPAAGMCGH